MTFPSFVSGEVLRAADMNAVGLWLVKTQAISASPVSSITVTGAFSADYDNYLIQVTDSSSNTGSYVGLQLGSKTSGYFWNLIYTSYAGSPIALGSISDTSMKYLSAILASQKVNVCLPVNGPFISSHTQVGPCNYADSGAAGTATGYDSTSTSYTAFTLVSGPGATFAGGTVRVYGYKK